MDLLPSYSISLAPRNPDVLAVLVDVVTPVSPDGVITSRATVDYVPTVFVPDVDDVVASSGADPVRVAPGSVAYTVDAITADHHIVAHATVYNVVAFAAVQRVVAIAAKYIVVAFFAVNCIVAANAVDNVVAVAAPDDVIAAPGADRKQAAERAAELGILTDEQ